MGGHGFNPEVQYLSIGHLNLRFELHGPVMKYSLMFSGMVFIRVGYIK